MTTYAGVLRGAALALACALPGAAAAQDITWNFGYTNAAGSNYVEIIRQVPDRIAAATGGRLKIEVYDTLVNGPEQPAAVREGRLDGSFALNVWMSAEAPFLNVSLLPGLITSPEMFQDLLDPVLREEFAAVWRQKYHAEPIGYGVFESQVVISKAPVHTLADFAGKKVRVSNTGQANMIVALGGAPTPVPFGEIVPSLQRGIVDIVMTSVGPATGMGFHDVAKEMSIWDITPVQPWTVIVNSDAWAALPDDLKAAVLAEFRKIEDESFAAWQAFTDARLDELVAKGVNLYRVPEDEVARAFEDKNIEPAFAQWYKLNEDGGTDGRALVEKIRAQLAGAGG